VCGEQASKHSGLSVIPGNGSPLDRPAHPQEGERYDHPDDVPADANNHGQNLLSREQDPDSEREKEGDDPDTVQPRTPPALLPPLPADPHKGGGDEEDHEAHKSCNDPGRAAHGEGVHSALRSFDGDHEVR